MGWDKVQEPKKDTIRYTVKGIGSRIKVDEDWELFNEGTKFLRDRGFDMWGRPLNEKREIGATYDPKKELNLNRWKTSETFSETDLLEWIKGKNEQHDPVNLVKTNNIKYMVWEKIKGQVHLFMNSGGNAIASNEDITENEALCFNLWIYENMKLSEIGEIHGVSRQMITKYLESFFTKIGLVLDIGIRIKNKLLEKFMKPEVIALRQALERQRAYKRSQKGKTIKYCGVIINKDYLEKTLTTNTRINQTDAKIDHPSKLKTEEKQLPFARNVADFVY